MGRSHSHDVKIGSGYRTPKRRPKRRVRVFTWDDWLIIVHPEPDAA